MYVLIQKAVVIWKLAKRLVEFKNKVNRQKSYKNTRVLVYKVINERKDTFQIVCEQKMMVGKYYNRSIGHCEAGGCPNGTSSRVASLLICFSTSCIRVRLENCVN